LEDLIADEKDKRIAERLIFVRLVYDLEPAEIAIQKIGRSRATAYNWLQRWNEGGAEGLKPTFNGGRPSKLSGKQQEELKHKLECRGNTTTKEARKLIAEEFGVNYSVDSVTRVLRSLGMRYSKPYPIDYRRPDDADARLKSALEASMQKLQDLEAQGKVVFGFLDECSPQSCANTVRVWSFGKPTTVKDTTKYRANTFGFYAPFGRSVVGFRENSKKENVCSFLEEVKASNPDKKILAILDNFRSHKAAATRAKAEELDISLVFLPPYSPDLSPIEQIWRGVKRAVSTAFFRTVDEFGAIIKSSYDGLSKQLSFAKGWLTRFMPQQSNQFCI
jgi:transposase